MNKKNHKKPIGTNGVFTVSREPNRNPTAEFKKTKWPNKKDDQEKIVVDRFVRAGNKAGFTIHNCTQNSESEFDFTLVVGNKETIYLELKEIVIPTEKGTPYDQKNQMLTAGEYSSHVVALIEKCSEGYRSKSQIPIHLLVYSTDWKFCLNDTIIALIQYALSKKKLIFEYVFSLNMISDDHEELRLLFPTDKNKWTDFKPEKYGQSIFANLDPRSWEVLSSINLD